LSANDIVATVTDMDMLEFIATLIIVLMVIAFLVAWDSNSTIGTNLRNEARTLLYFPAIVYQAAGGAIAPRVALVLATRSASAASYLTRVRKYETREAKHRYREETHVELSAA